jgi:small subunit ribosomal protein S2
MPVVLEDLFKVGAHFGHKTRYWNPKMKPYIFGKRNKIHIINLDKTFRLYQDAVNFVSKTAARKGGKVLFVGTKRAAQDIVAEEAQRCGMPYVNHRWLGGMLTNYKTVRQSIKRLKELEKMKEEGVLERLVKKESLMRTREMNKLELSLGGIKFMGGLPDIVLVIDSDKERIAIEEAKKLGIPVIGIVDTNSNPDDVDYLIPANDDAKRAIRCYLGGIVDAILDAKVAAQTESVGYEPSEKKAAKKVEAKIEKKDEKAEKVEESKKVEAKPAAKKAEKAEKVEAKPAAKKAEKKSDEKDS